MIMKSISVSLILCACALQVAGRFGTPEEMGKCCLFLATDGTYCTGAEFKCTGGCDLGIGLKVAKDVPYI